MNISMMLRDYQIEMLGRVVEALAGHRSVMVQMPTGTGKAVLVNLEMVRIRRRSDSLDGLNIYVMDGKYGVMKDGRMTTQPVFERVRRCESSRLFALATYPYALFKNRTTVIDLQGIDQMVQLYGQIELKGDFLYGDDVRGNGCCGTPSGRSTTPVGSRSLSGWVDWMCCMTIGMTLETAMSCVI